jgi:hypothetical protein
MVDETGIGNSGRRSIYAMLRHSGGNWKGERTGRLKETQWIVIISADESALVRAI